MIKKYIACVKIKDFPETFIICSGEKGGMRIVNEKEKKTIESDVFLFDTHREAEEFAEWYKNDFNDKANGMLPLSIVHSWASTFTYQDR